MLFSRIKDSHAQDQPTAIQKPTLVLVHGLFGSMENLGGIARILSEDFRVVSVDLPNHGRSSHSAAMSLGSMAEDLAAWASEQAITQAYWVGHSLGGKAVMELALRHPHICRKVVVLDIAPVTYPPRHDDVFKGLQAVEPATLTSRSEADKRMAPYVSELAVRSFLLKNLEKAANGFVWRMNLEAITQSYDALSAANSKDIPPFEGDTLFVKGSESNYVQEAHRQAIMERFPKAALRIVSGVGHWLHAEKPETIARIIERFLNDV